MKSIAKKCLKKIVPTKPANIESNVTTNTSKKPVPPVSNELILQVMNKINKKLSNNKTPQSETSPSPYRRWIQASFDFQGIHQWSKSNTFLKHPHRHKFFCTVWIEVNHNDRDIEFIEFINTIKPALINYFVETGLKCDNNNIVILENMSCEDICDVIHYCIEQKYGFNRKIKIRVLEDNENGAFVEY